MSEPITPKTQEPTTLASLLTQFIARYQPGTRMHNLGVDLLRSHSQTRDRRAAVLKHKDLAGRLVDELGYAKAEQWNGYIPPAFIDPSGQERLCQGASPGRHGDFLARLNQVGRYALGEMPNASPRRKILLEISQEAWDREHPAAPEGPP